MKFLLTTALAVMAAASCVAKPTSISITNTNTNTNINGGANKNNEERKKFRLTNLIFEFDAIVGTVATPDQVRNGTTPAPGQPGAYGTFKFGLQPSTNTICYNITVFGVTGEYRSPAVTATHIHEAARGASGPPRIAFPNPVGDDTRRVSVGCLTGPFRTGVPGPDGRDTGEGFNVQKIVDNTTNFFADTHTVMFPLGAIRGQLERLG
ncbi:MAG: hypothetical protein M1817_004568 [Caeruleum heppii]|nr:MAG: hypothetical protein M1817_004568 [Caeruleum heppii]